MFHCITNDRSKWFDVDYSISTETFLKLVERYREKGFEFRPVNELAGSRENSIYITFDDGFEGIYTELMPELRNRKIPVCVFQTVDYIGGEQYLKKEMLKEMVEDPLCIIGSHTFSHPRLRDLSKKNSEYEITESGKTLTDMLKKKIDYFAFPYGSVECVSCRDVEIAKTAGYRFVFSTMQTYLTEKSVEKAGFIPRYNINEDIALRLISKQDYNSNERR